MRVRQPLQLFLQLNLDELPDEAKQQPGLGGLGLLQVFYHHVPVDQPGGGECYAEPAWEAFDGAHKTVRIVRPVGESEESNQNNESDLEPARIVGWKSHDDVPTIEDAGIDFDFGSGGGQPRVNCDAINLSRSLSDDDAIDGVPYLDYLFGDCGTAHVFRCPAYPDIVTLSWACG